MLGEAFKVKTMVSLKCLFNFRMSSLFTHCANGSLVFRHLLLAFVKLLTNLKRVSHWLCKDLLTFYWPTLGQWYFFYDNQMYKWFRVKKSVTARWKTLETGGPLLQEKRRDRVIWLQLFHQKIYYFSFSREIYLWNNSLIERPILLDENKKRTSFIRKETLIIDALAKLNRKCKR